MSRRINFPVMVGVVPLVAVSNFVLKEGYETAKVGRDPRFTQLTRPSTKTIEIQALLVGPWRALRPALEAMALTSRGLAAPAGVLEQFSGVPVITASSVSLDMQITSLTFTQTNEMYDALTVNITLQHVPRSVVTESVGLGADVALAVVQPAVAAAFI